MCSGQPYLSGIVHKSTPTHIDPLTHPGLTPEEAKEKPFIASMGIYVFKKQVLIDLLTEVGMSVCVVYVYVVYMCVCVCVNAFV
jgi:hypothetical protein